MNRIQISSPQLRRTARSSKFKFFQERPVWRKLGGSFRRMGDAGRFGSNSGEPQAPLYDIDTNIEVQAF